MWNPSHESLHERIPTPAMRWIPAIHVFSALPRPSPGFTSLHACAGSVVARACRTRAKPVQHGKRETCVETTLERLLLHTFSVCQGPARTDSIVIYLFVGQRAARLSLIPRWFQGMSQCLHSSFRVLFRLRGQGFIHQ